MVDINYLKSKAPLYIIGHKKPDVDTVMSSYLLSNIFNYLGIESYYCVLNKDYELDFYNKRIVDDFLDYKPEVIDVNNIGKYNFVLVDHNDPLQSINEGNIIYGIDHHAPCGKTYNILFNDLCSNTLFIYDYFKDMYSFTDEEKKLVMIATLTDTLFLKTTRYTPKDKPILEGLNISFNSNELLEKYFIGTDLSNGIRPLLEHSDRDYFLFGFSFSSSVVQTTGNKEKEILEYKNLIENNDKNHLGIWRDLSNNMTYVYLKIDNYFKEFKYNTIASRATTIMNDVSEYLNNLNK